MRNTRDIFKTLYFPDRPRGHVHLVDNSANFQGGPRAYDTLAEALADVVDYRGDTIVIGAGHSETLTGNPSLTIAQDNVRIISEGGYATRAAFLLDGAATAHVKITGEDVHIENCLFKAGHADIAKAIDVQGKGCILRGNWFKENVADENFLIAINVGAANNDADGIIIEGNHISQPDGDQASTHAIWFLKDQIDCIVKGNIIQGNYAADSALIGSPATENFLNLTVIENLLDNNAGDSVHVIEFAGTNTGIMARNLSGDVDADGTPFIGTGMSLCENYHTGAVTTSGFIYPVRDT